MINTNFLSINSITKRGSKNFSKKFEKIILDINKDIKDNKKILNILNKNFKFNFKIGDLKKYKKFKIIAILGMGGSILGAEAIHNYFQHKIKKKFYFFDDLDEDKIINFKKKENFSKVLFIIISKSGNTIETLSNSFALNIIKSDRKNVILISEKKNNSLFILSKKLNLHYIEHKDHIGGRFSVLSETGLIPAYLMGVNIFKLRSKIRDILKGSNKLSLKNSSIKLASIMNSKKFDNLIFLNYSSRLEKLLYWGQQLIAESLGKKNKGFLPVISNVPKDHHSLLQLYLDGPKNKIFNIFSLKTKKNEKINAKNQLEINSYLNKKKIFEIKNAQKMSLIKSLKKKNIPFREFKIKNSDEVTLGKLFSFFIIETIIIGKLLNINPFNQPAVEQVKKDTKKYLSKNTKNNF